MTLNLPAKPMTEPEEVTLHFSDPTVDELGKALQYNCTAEYNAERYWVVNATYNKRRDTLTFRLSPAWFCHQIASTL